MDKRYLMIYLIITVTLVILGVAGYLMPPAHLTAYLTPFMGFLVYAVTIAVILSVVLDAGKRYPKGSYGPILWGLVVLFLNLVGLVLYFLLRPKQGNGR